MSNIEKKVQSEIAIRDEQLGFLKGIKMIIPSLFWPWSAFHSIDDKTPHRRMSLGPLLGAVVAFFLALIQVVLFELHKLIIDGTIPLLPGLTEEALYPMMYVMAAIIAVVSVIMQWLSVAAISYFLCRLMNQQLDFSHLLTLTAFSFIPTILVYLIEAVLFAIDTASAIILLKTVSVAILINIVSLIWPAAIQTFVLESVSEIDRRKAIIAAFIAWLIPLMMGLASSQSIVGQYGM